MENTTLRSLHILYTFVLRAEIVTILSRKCGNNVPMHVIQTYTKFANFARLYFPSFTTFRNRILQFY